MSVSNPPASPEIEWTPANKRAYREGQLRAYVDNTPAHAYDKDIFRRETIVLSAAYLQGNADYAKQIPPSLNWAEHAHERADNALEAGYPAEELPDAFVKYIEYLTRELEHYALRAAFAEERVAKLQIYISERRYITHAAAIPDADKGSNIGGSATSFVEGPFANPYLANDDDDLLLYVRKLMQRVTVLEERYAKERCNAKYAEEFSKL